MFRDTLTVYKKEVISILKDKTVLFMCIILPFLVMFGEGKLMTVMNDTDTGTDKSFIRAYAVNAPEYMNDALKEIGFDGAPADVDKTISDIKNKDAELLVIFPEDFTVEVTEGDQVSDIEVYYNSSYNESLMIKEMFYNYLDTLRPVAFTINADTAKTYDQGDETYQGRNAMASMVPGLLVMTIVYGIMGLASNIIAGDKESNFLNTVLITPVSRTSVALGKALAVMTAALISSLSSFVGLSFLMNSFKEMIGSDIINYAVMDYVYVFITILCVTFALVGLILIISTLAKTSRSAQTLTAIPVMILFIGSFLTSNSGFDSLLTKLGFYNYVIPMWNATYLTKNILLNGFTPVEMLTACGINLAFGALCLAFISRMFNNEKIVND